MTYNTRLGKSELHVNPIGLGANAVGGHNLYPNLDEEDGKEVVRTAIQNGVHFLDTAFIYGPGRSEELIGQVLKEIGSRDQVVIATKGAHDEHQDYQPNNNPDFLKKQVEDSLKRLQTDYIDLYYIHFPDEHTPKDEAVGMLQRLKEEGKIRAIGVSNFSIAQLKEANKNGYVDVLQSEYNLLNREVEKEILPYTSANQITFIPYFPLVSGLLAGKYNSDTKFNDLRKNNPQFQGEQFIKNLEKVEQLRKIANRKNTEVAHLVLAWYLTQPSVDALIPGAKHSDQVLSNLKTLDVKLSQDEVSQIDRIFS